MNREYPMATSRLDAFGPDAVVRQDGDRGDITALDLAEIKAILAKRGVSRWLITRPNFRTIDLAYPSGLTVGRILRIPNGNCFVLPRHLLAGQAYERPAGAMADMLTALGVS